MKKFLATITIALLAITATAQVRVNASLDSTKILIGERTHWYITVDAPKGSRVAYQHFADTTNVPHGIEVMEQRIDTTHNGNAYTLTFKRTLTAWDARHYNLPAVTIQVDGKNYTTNKLAFNVTQSKVDTAATAPAKPADAVQKPPFLLSEWLPYIALCVLALVLLIVAYTIHRRLKSKKPLAKPRQQMRNLLPHEKAMQAIEQVKTQYNNSENPDQKAYYTALTDVLRQYLEDRFGIKAKEMTSADIVETLRQKSNNETNAELEQVFATADLVKFAKSKPSDNNAEYDRETIENVVIKTKEAIPVVVAEGEVPTQDAFAMSVLKIRERRKRRNRVALIVALCFVVLAPVLLMGYSILYNKYFNTYASINRSEWVTSDYGYPITELTTPEILIRKQIVDVTEYKSIIDKQYTFYYGSLNSPLYIMTNIITFKKDAQHTAPQQEEQGGGLTLDPQKVNEIVLSQLDKAKAKNITTLQEEYTSPSGAKGIKVFGKMSIPNEKGKYFSASYELYSFTENNALQQVLITHIDEPNADKIAQRVINSIVFKTE